MNCDSDLHWLGLGVSEGGFFDDAGLKSKITVRGQTYDCTALRRDSLLQCNEGLF